MDDLLLNPAFQSGVAPALAAAAVAAFVLRTRVLVLVPLAAFAVVVWLAVGFTFDANTARAKAVLVVAAAGIVALALDAAGRRPEALPRALLAALAVAAALWIAQRVLQQKEGAALWSTAAAVVAWAVAVPETWRLNAADPVRAFAAAMVLGFALGVLGLFGASASVAMTGIAFGAASGVALALFAWRGRPAAAAAFATLPVAAFVVAGGLVASLTGELPAAALLPLLLVPVAVRLVPRNNDAPPWRDAAFASAAAALPALVAGGLAA